MNNSILGIRRLHQMTSSFMSSSSFKNGVAKLNRTISRPLSDKPASCNTQVQPPEKNTLEKIPEKNDVKFDERIDGYYYRVFFSSKMCRDLIEERYSNPFPLKDSLY